MKEYKKNRSHWAALVGVCLAVSGATPTEMPRQIALSARGSRRRSGIQWLGWGGDALNAAKNYLNGPLHEPGTIPKLTVPAVV